MSVSYATFEALRESFTGNRASIDPHLIIDGASYRLRGSEARGDNFVMIWEGEAIDGETTPIIELGWSRVGTVLLPSSATINESVSTVLLPVSQVEGMSCAVLEHHATIGGVSIQVDVDESLTTPRLYLSPDQLDATGQDATSCLPHMSRLTLGEQTVFVYADGDRLILPTVVVETAQGLTLHNVDVEVSPSTCPHLALPSILFNHRS